MLSCSWMYVSSIITVRARTNHRQLDAISPPTIQDTAVVKLPMWAYRKTLGRFLGPKEAVLDDQEDAEPDTLEEVALDEATSLNGVEAKQKSKPRARQR